MYRLGGNKMTLTDQEIIDNIKKIEETLKHKLNLVIVTDELFQQLKQDSTEYKRIMNYKAWKKERAIE